jgi:hypothetical protein
MVAMVEARCIVAWITLVAKMAVISWLLKPWMVVMVEMDGKDLEK